MKSNLLLSIMLTISVSGFSQFGTEQIITTNAIEATSVYVADINGDGNLDILSSSWNQDKIAWYENTDGLGTFGTEQIISTNADGADCVRAFDLDGDGDIDVLSSSYYDNKIAWYENTDGQGTFGPQQVITTSLIYGSWVYASDIDGDGDLDVLSASIDDDKIAWYENTNGQGTFGSQQVIANPDGPNNVIASDIDGDGDMDILFDASSGDEIAWCENTDGNGTFGPKQIITNNTNLPTSVYTTDIDGDGDLDVVSSSINDDKIAWYENTDGQGTFGSQQIITTNADEARYAFPVDIDNDGDIDIISASWNDDKVAWYENIDGQGTFSSQQIISTNADGASGVYAVDFDGDGKVDVVSSSYFDNKIAWYKNNLILGVNDYSSRTFSIIPNPVSNILTIDTKMQISQVEVFNNLGQILMTVSNSNIIDFSKLNQGVYYIKIKNNESNFVIKKIIKK